MFGIGTPELILILILALLIIGPKDLPKVGREVGKALRNLMVIVDDIRNSISSELEDGNLKKGQELDKEKR